MDHTRAFAISNLEVVLRTCCIYIGSSRTFGRDFDTANCISDPGQRLFGKVSFQWRGWRDRRPGKTRRFRSLCRVRSLLFRASSRLRCRCPRWTCPCRPLWREQRGRSRPVWRSNRNRLRYCQAWYLDVQLLRYGIQAAPSAATSSVLVPRALQMDQSAAQDPAK